MSVDRPVQLNGPATLVREYWPVAALPSHSGSAPHDPPSGRFNQLQPTTAYPSTKADLSIQLDRCDGRRSAGAGISRPSTQVRTGWHARRAEGPSTPTVASPRHGAPRRCGPLCPPLLPHLGSTVRGVPRVGVRGPPAGGSGGLGGGGAGDRDGDQRGAGRQQYQPAREQADRDPGQGRTVAPASARTETPGEPSAFITTIVQRLS